MVLMGTVFGSITIAVLLALFPTGAATSIVPGIAMYYAEALAFIFAVVTLWGVSTQRSDFGSLFVYSLSFASSLSATIFILRPGSVHFVMTLLCWAISMIVAASILHLLSPAKPIS
jgi:hypothetical protein